jgi:hypothetical protein
VAPSLSPEPLRDGAFYLDLQQQCRFTGYVYSHLTAPGPGLPDPPCHITEGNTLDPIQKALQHCPAVGRVPWVLAAVPSSRQGGRSNRSMSRPTGRAAGAEGAATLLGGSPVGTARRRVVSVAEGVTGLGLPERVEPVRAALPGADRGRFEQELDQALDTARSTRGPAAARPGRRGLVSGGVRPPARRCGGQRPRRGWAVVKSRSGRPKRLTSRTRSAASGSSPRCFDAPALFPLLPRLRTQRLIRETDPRSLVVSQAPPRLLVDPCAGEWSTLIFITAKSRAAEY